MKNKVMMAIICLGTALCFVASLPAQQISDRHMLTVTVPFNFNAGNMSLPAGQYEVLHVMNPGWVMLKASDGNAMAVMQVIVSPMTTESEANKLIFKRYHGKYYLAQVLTANDYEVHSCRPTTPDQTIAFQSNDAVAIPQ